MKPRKPLGRHTRLVAKTELKRGAPLRRSPIKQRGSVGAIPAGGPTPPPNGPTKPRKPATPDERAARAGVRARSGGVCERCRLRAAREWHHRRTRSQGGAWSLANGVDLCRSCHRWIGENPAESYATGWLVPHGVTPEEWPVRRWTPAGLVWMQPGETWTAAEPHERQRGEAA